MLDMNNISEMPVDISTPFLRLSFGGKDFCIDLAEAQESTSLFYRDAPHAGLDKSAITAEQAKERNDYVANAVKTWWKKSQAEVRGKERLEAPDINDAQVFMILRAIDEGWEAFKKKFDLSLMQHFGSEENSTPSDSPEQ